MKLALTLIVALVAALTAAQSSVAVVFVPTQGGPSVARYQRWADTSRMPTVVERLELRPLPCPGVPWAAGCTWSGLPAIYVGPITRRQNLLHELGHRLDYVMPGAVRAGFERITHDHRPWRSPVNSPHERFAEAYSLCAMSPRRLPRGVTTSFGYHPTARQHKRICRLITHTASRRR